MKIVIDFNRDLGELAEKKNGRVVQGSRLDDSEHGARSGPDICH
jgi:hypothetical protein